ncbi:MAG: HyaD/HybD family hydrogenase maturation endopeptidase [Deltaproteobacteria bacterium]|nr:HyaD/HybD family hydrogenase maturation endopeptidase [Deltaproteobacteria bacterium]
MAQSKKRKALILGIGNILLKDEGVGVRAMELFKETYEPTEAVSCVDGGTSGIGLLSLIKDFTHIIIFDAVSSDSPPGTIHRFSGKDLEKGPPLKTTAHQLGVKDLLLLSAFEGHRPEVSIIGIVPGNISAGLALTPLIKGKLPEAIEAAAEELTRFGFKVKKRKKDA